MRCALPASPTAADMAFFAAPLATTTTTTAASTARPPSDSAAGALRSPPYSRRRRGSRRADRPRCGRRLRTTRGEHALSPPPRLPALLMAKLTRPTTAVLKTATAVRPQARVAPPPTSTQQASCALSASVGTRPARLHLTPSAHAPLPIAASSESRACSTTHAVSTLHLPLHASDRESACPDRRTAPSIS